ncbi:helix-turn-helix domain-containing protein [Eggerthella sp. YY7918]|uniref:helix-turn-helix domain-containing protein n=1 Tax=Eggerthella sp. (strain YY7918) TaxID=502558 RepID=UPI0002171584|nr:helix-turn-helix transcriptional regulator [Eggerthella sp. YY7918]BAK44950.1 hypothetical protein EGYY_18150 [Eggerthella sp. YY7918]
MYSSLRKKLLGQKIRELRLAKGLSQVDLGLMIGSSKSQIWALENGHTNPKLDTLCKIADALDVRVSDLISF